MAENTDKKWKEYLMFVLHDLDAFLPIFKGYSHILGMYLEKLKEQDSLATTVDTPVVKEMTPQMALEMIQIIERHTDKLGTIQREWREEISKLHDEQN